MEMPAQQIKAAIVAHLRGVCGGFTLPIPQEQIRGLLDVSGTPRDAYGIVVSCEDLGDHFGNTGGVLVDVRPSITIYTHINEDEDGGLCDAIASDVLGAMQSIAYILEGWLVAWNGSWTVADTTMDGSYRQIALSATLPLNRI